jgi:hypothetical protein
MKERTEMTPHEESTIREFIADDRNWADSRRPLSMLLKEIDRLRELNVDLLEACKRVLQEISHYPGELSVGCEEDLKAAIEKAEAR